MGNLPPGMGGAGFPGAPPGNNNNANNNQNNKDTQPKRAPPQIAQTFRKKGESSLKLPAVTPISKCRLRYLKVERIKDYLLIEKEFIDFFEKDRATQSAQEDEDEYQTEDRKIVEQIRGTPIDVGNLEEIINDDNAIVSTPHGSDNYVKICSFVDRDLLEPGASVLLHHQSHAIIGVLQETQDTKLNVMKVEQAPLASYAEIGGLESQIQELTEAVELPLTNPQIYEDMGIKPPKGVILYGPPGTGKTLLAKAVANKTSATFLRLVGSELVQSYSGEGPKLVRNLFKKAAEEAPSIVFIDEIDAIGTKRYNTNSGGAKEVQRTMLELLNQLDGFDTNNEVKVIMATNRIETLDPALIRPGRIDRKIEIPEPDLKTQKKIFGIHTSKMNFADDVKVDDIIGTKDELSGADIKALCSEAGMLALRERRMKVTIDDFKKAKEKILQIKKGDVPDGLYI